MYKVLGVSAVLLVSGLAVAQTAVKLSEKVQKKLDAADAAYQQAVAKADNARFYAVQKANADRVKVLKQAMTEATKAGDLDAATEIKGRITAAETEGGTRAKPKNVVKFGGHEYALIEEKATWHVAKRICEEMGGHLATMESQAEMAGLAEMCKQAKVTAWAGATDEESEGNWHWVTGKPVTIEFRHDNANDSEHCMIFWLPNGDWDDNPGSYRNSFICEWDN